MQNRRHMGKGHRGFIFDLLSLFLIVLVLGIVLVMSYVINSEIVRSATASGLDGTDEAEEVTVTRYEELDWLLPFAFGFGSVVMLTYAYMSGSSGPVIVLFILFGMVLAM